MKSNMKQYEFIGDCARLRNPSGNKNPQNELKWQKMMKIAKSISLDTFLLNANLKPLWEDEYEEGEDAEALYIQDELVRQQAEYFQSKWGEVPCVFYKVAGFEYIFVKKNKNNYIKELIHNECVS